MLQADRLHLALVVPDVELNPVAGDGGGDHRFRQRECVAEAQRVRCDRAAYLGRRFVDLLTTLTHENNFRDTWSWLAYFEVMCYSGLRKSAPSCLVAHTMYARTKYLKPNDLGTS